MVSKFKPRMPILCATYREKTAQQTALLWGVKPILTNHFGATEEMIAQGFEAGLREGLLKVGDLVAMRRLRGGFGCLGFGIIGQGRQLGESEPSASGGGEEDDALHHADFREVQSCLANGGDACGERCAGILPARMSSAQNSWCSRAQASST